LLVNPLREVVEPVTVLVEPAALKVILSK
jgi:hypothetical protein